MVRERLEHAPKGSLKLAHSNGTVQYNQLLDNRLIYLNKDHMELVRALAQKGYFEGKNLIYTMESFLQPFHRKEARRIIEQYLL